jgi:hypothetical protein
MKRAMKRAVTRHATRVRTTLLMTAAAFAGFTAIAAAQTPQGAQNGGAAKPDNGQIEQKAAPGGALKYQNGAQPGEKTTRPDSVNRPGGAGQGAQADRPDQRLGQQKNEVSPQHGAQETGKPDINAATTTSPGKSGGTAVQLSPDQRSRIGAMIGKSSAARVTTKGNFDVSVGAKIPRDVHITVLPEDVVQIVPQYEGYDYVLLGDQILIVDPSTLEIVAVIEA